MLKKEAIEAEREVAKTRKSKRSKNRDFREIRIMPKESRSVLVLVPKVPEVETRV